MNNYFEMEFPSNPCNESFARMVVSGFVIELDPTFEEISEIKTAISEAVTNAVIHAYKNEFGIVKISASINGDKVTFIVSDNGMGIDDVDKAMEPLYTGAPDMERSGMGFTIMQEFMDEVFVDSKVGVGTIVKMTKTINREEPLNGK